MRLSKKTFINEKNPSPIRHKHNNNLYYSSKFTRPYSSYNPRKTQGYKAHIQGSFLPESFIVNDMNDRNLIMARSVKIDISYVDLYTNAFHNGFKHIEAHVKYNMYVQLVYNDKLSCTVIKHI